MNNGYIVFTKGLGTLGVILIGEDRTTRWNGSAIVSISSVESAAWDAGVLTATEQISVDSQPSGIYVFSVPEEIAAQNSLG